MDRMFVYRLADDSHIEHVAVAVGVPRAHSPHSLHAGIIRLERNSPLMVHLAWQDDLQIEPAPEGYIWVRPRFSSRRLRQVAAKCRQVENVHANGGLPYGFSLPRHAFDEAGNYTARADQKGLTCATFIVALFESVGVALIDSNGWISSRVPDVRWQKFIINQLSGHGFITQANNISPDVGSLRFRPDEVAAAAQLSTDTWAADFQTISAVTPELRWILFLDSLRKQFPAGIDDNSPLTVSLKDMYVRLGKTDFLDRITIKNENSRCVICFIFEAQDIPFFFAYIDDKSVLSLETKDSKGAVNGTSNSDGHVEFTERFIAQLRAI